MQRKGWERGQRWSFGEGEDEEETLPKEGEGVPPRPARGWGATAQERWRRRRRYTMQGGGGGSVENWERLGGGRLGLKCSIYSQI